MKKIGRRLIMYFLAFLSVVMVFSALSVYSRTGYADEAGEPQVQVESYETSWCRLEYSGNRIEVLFNANFRDFSSVTKSELAGVKNFLTDALTDVMAESILNAPAAVYALAADELPDIGDLDDIDIGRLESYIYERLSDPAELGKYLDGSYDALLKVAVNKLVTDYEYEYEQVQDKLVEVVNNVIESVYEGDDAAITAAKDKNAQNTADIVNDAKESGGNLNLTIGDIQNALDKVRVNGATVYEDRTIDLAGLKKLLLSLPKPYDIANYSDDEMKLEFDVELYTAYGDADFELAVGFYGDCSNIRGIAQFIADHVDVSATDGVYSMSVKAPEALSKLLLKLTETSRISDGVKNKIFSLFGKTGYDLMDKVESISYEELLELLKSVDYKGIFANIFNADLINGYLGEYADIFNITDEKIDQFVNGILNVFKGKDFANMSADSIKEFIGRYVDISLLDNARLDAAVNKLLGVLAKIDFDRYDAELIREFFDPDSAYTNQSIYNIIDKLSGFGDYYDRVINYAERLFNALPESVKNHTILDIYKGDGELSFSGKLNVNLETVFEKLKNEAVRLGFTEADGILDNLIVLFEKTEYSANLSFDLSLKSIYKVSYNLNGEEVRAGLLPVGADLALFSNLAEVNGYAITAWVDESGAEYVKMPAQDIALYAITAFDVQTSVEGDVEKVYDGQTARISVAVSGAYEDALYTYQWYKDGVLLEGANTASVEVKNVADSGAYVCAVTSAYGVTVESDEMTVEISAKEVAVPAADSTVAYNGEYQTFEIDESADYTVSGELTHRDAGVYIITVALADKDNTVWENGGTEDISLTFEITKLTVDVSGYVWNYTGAFTYDGTEKSVALTGVDTALVSVTYENDKKTDAGEYTAKATLTLVDSVNYLLSGEAELTLAWTIDRAEINVGGYEWNYTEPYTYSGEQFTVALKAVDDKLEAVYTGNTGTDANTYSASVALSVKAEYASNYTLAGLDGVSLTLSWTINPKTIDVSLLEWDYEARRPLIYSGSAYTVALKELPAEVKLDKYTGNTATDAGEYTAVAALLPVNGNYVLSANSVTLDWVIETKTVDFKGAAWDYIEAFVYSGEEHTVTLKNVPTLPEGLTLAYAGNTATDAGTYTASVSLNDSRNYTIVGLPTELEWEIIPLVVDASAFEWNYEAPFSYDGTEKKVELKNLPDYVVAIYVDNVHTDVGDYKAKATLAATSDNYEVAGQVADLEWKIVLAVYGSGNVIVIDNTGAVAGSELSVKEVTDLGNVKLQQITGQGERAVLGVAYDISFVLNGAENKVEGDFTVKILMPEGLRDKTTKVAHIGEDGVVTEIEVSVDSDGYAVFKTTHFSTYAILEITDVSKGDMLWLWIIVGELAAVIVVILIVKIARHVKAKKAAKAEENGSDDEQDEEQE